ncbi:hypothetical protein [Nocardia sp. NPDC050406]|uniref:hypothetical protein n=1 Tax=Nocardia sp. NPDC050406 TaxID=3364318 RepID=UPI0037B27122
MTADDQPPEESGARRPARRGFFAVGTPSRWELVILALLTVVAAPSVADLIHGRCQHLTFAGVLCWVLAIGIMVLWVVNLYALVRERVRRNRR